MYLVRENVIDNKTTGYWVDEKIDGQLITSHFITLYPKITCSCQYFQESHNPLNHFHIQVLKYWLKEGSPKFAMYKKSKIGKVIKVFDGFSDS